MKNTPLKIVTFIAIAFLISCSTNKELIGKNKTEYGNVKFYIENDLKNSYYKKRVLAVFQGSIFYSFYSNKIVKTKKNDKGLIYTLTFGEIPQELNHPKYFEKLSRIDSMIIEKADKILDSLEWNNYKKSKGANGFIIEVE